MAGTACAKQWQSVGEERGQDSRREQLLVQQLWTLPPVLVLVVAVVLEGYADPLLEDDRIGQVPAIAADVAADEPIGLVVVGRADLRNGMYQKQLYEPVGPTTTGMLATS